MTVVPSLSISTLGTTSIERFLDFYEGQLGMQASPIETLGGTSFEGHWSLPPGSTARAVLLSVGGSPVGRVLGLQFSAPKPLRLTDGSRGPFIGYWNLNFYVDRIVEACADLEARGFRFWSKPTQHAVAGGAGAPVEAIFLGPDDVAINLVQLDDRPGSTIGEIHRETAHLPRSRTGYSQVATSPHATRDIESAARFYRDVLGMWPSIDAILESPAVNAMTGRPSDARTRVIWLRGSHPYGKIALSQPLNYELVDRARNAAAPAIGYLAQGFAVTDLDAALGRAAACGAARLGEPQFLDLPGGLCLRTALLRAPGSGALVQLFEQKDDA